MPLQGAKEFRVAFGFRGRFGEHDDIEIGQLVKAKTKRLARQPLQTITHDTVAGRFLGDGQSESRMALPVPPPKHGKAGVTGAQRLLEYCFELTRTQ